MSESIELGPILRHYLAAHNPAEPAILQRLRAKTESATDAPQMLISWEQAAFMQLLARATGARRYLEIGVFTGYSSLALALAMPEDARIVACDVSAEWTAIARRYWEEAGVAGRIDLQLRPAADSINELIAAGEAFDICFIDADKENYDVYYEGALSLLRPGGIVMLDNMLWGGKVADPAAGDLATEAIRALNRKIAGDTRAARCLTAIGDGLALAVKL
ncbi:MAG TPA: class I SAM-dependent methyltransferase [Sphingomonadales bacterium]